MKKDNTYLKIILTIICAPIFSLMMLSANWMLVPQIINLFSKINFVGPFAYGATTNVQLILDLILSFVFTFGFMFIASILKKVSNIALVIFMAFCGWAFYFLEVGFFKGMIESIYPLWYEIISFIEYPLSAVLVIYLKNYKSITSQSTGPDSVPSDAPLGQ